MATDTLPRFDERLGSEGAKASHLREDLSAERVSIRLPEGWLKSIG
jgi:hypothetical protein